MVQRNLLVITMILTVSWVSCALQLSAKASFKVADTTSKSGYILRADQEAVKWKDTTYYIASELRSCRYARIPVTLTNITADTLKYIDMSCSTLDIFTTNLKYIRISQNLDNCFKNNPTMFKLAPYASMKFELPIYFFSIYTGAKQVLTTKEFKIGMGVLKYTGKIFMAGGFQDIGLMMRNNENLVWSNTITIR